MRTSVYLLSFYFVLFAAPVMADREPPELSEYGRHDLRVTTICIEGHVVIVAHSDVGKGGGLGLMQLESEVNGRVVPLRCNKDGALRSQERVGGTSLFTTPESRGEGRNVGR